MSSFPKMKNLTCSVVCDISTETHTKCMIEQIKITKYLSLFVCRIVFTESTINLESSFSLCHLYFLYLLFHCSQQDFWWLRFQPLGGVSFKGFQRGQDFFYWNHSSKPKKLKLYIILVPKILAKHSLISGYLYQKLIVLFKPAVSSPNYKTHNCNLLCLGTFIKY